MTTEKENNSGKETLITERNEIQKEKRGRR
jgi:hypothetical protein